MKHFLSTFLVVVLFASFLTCLHAQQGDVAATYAFEHTWDYSSYEYSDDCTDFISKCEQAGGWQFVGRSPYYRSNPGVWYKTPYSWLTSYTWAGANNFEDFLSVSGRTQRVWNPTDLQPGDIIVTDWGQGDEFASSDRYNRADGVGDHVMIVHQNLGNGDVVYCQHSYSKMRRLWDVKSVSVFDRAQFRLYHVVGNNALFGLAEGRMYRELNHPEVYLSVNRGKFWVKTYQGVAAFGGWGNVTVVPDGALHTGYGGSLPIEGTMVRELNRPEVYLVEHWPYIAHILTAAKVNQYGGWPAVRLVPDQSLDNYWRGYDVF